jgi:hypothetical protein
MIKYGIREKLNSKQKEGRAEGGFVRTTCFYPAGMTAACAGGRVQESCRLGFPAKVSCSTPLAQCVALCEVAGGQQEATEQKSMR